MNPVPSPGLFVNGVCTDSSVMAQLNLVGRQVVEFSRLQLRARHENIGPQGVETQFEAQSPAGGASDCAADDP
jgi:hypothetical protein